MLTINTYEGIKVDKISEKRNLKSEFPSLKKERKKVRSIRVGNIFKSMGAGVLILAYFRISRYR